MIDIFLVSKGVGRVDGGLSGRRGALVAIKARAVGSIGTDVVSKDVGVLIGGLV